MAIYVLLASLIVPSVHASTNGMDMSMDGSMALASGKMLFYLHFTPGDTLWFQGWVPLSNGAMAGACIGLFMLALVERWLVAIRAMAEVVWRKQAEIAYINAQNATLDSTSESHLFKPPTVASVITLRSIPPFIPDNDIARGIMHAGQAALTLAFMMVAMTFQASFIFSVIIGFGVGEAIFGRHISAASLH